LSYDPALFFFLLLKYSICNQEGITKYRPWIHRDLSQSLLDSSQNSKCQWSQPPKVFLDLLKFWRSGCEILHYLCSCEEGCDMIVPTGPKIVTTDHLAFNFFFTFNFFLGTSKKQQVQ
jgi:hypothetical protein